MFYNYVLFVHAFSVCKLILQFLFVCLLVYLSFPGLDRTGLSSCLFYISV